MSDKMSTSPSSFSIHRLQFTGEDAGKYKHLKLQEEDV